MQVGLGTVDYARIIQLLEREGYNRALSVDLDRTQLDDEMRALEMRKLRLLLPATAASPPSSSNMVPGSGNG